jgi:F-type H+-transporting ATPase subunit alpha
MQINPSEISELIKSKIQNLRWPPRKGTEGTVISVTDGICRVTAQRRDAGRDARVPGNTFGLALNLERDSVAPVVLGTTSTSPRATPVKATGRILEVPWARADRRVGELLGQPIDGKGRSPRR